MMHKLPVNQFKRLLFCIGLLVPNTLYAIEIATVENPAYFSVMYCEARIPLAVIYTIGKDMANSERYSQYIDDPQLMASHPQCHPITDHTYKTYQSVLRSKKIEASYDVGHLAMSNHLDGSDALSRLANQFTNLAPQASKLNRKGGAWYHTEMISECMRELEDLIIVAGTIDDKSTTEQDYFVDTFGQKTPDHFYKVIYFTKSNLYKAWFIPNSPDASQPRLESGAYDITLERLDQYLPIEMQFFHQLIDRQVPQANPLFLETKVGSKELTCRGNTTSVS